MDNGDDSNPLWLYLLLDRAVFQNGHNNAKIKDVRSNLMRAAARELTAQGRSTEVGPALASIRSANTTMFTPQLWKIETAKIVGRYTGGHQYLDEFLITDLLTHEFEVIIE
jgi:hypothetical protein